MSGFFRGNIDLAQVLMTGTKAQFNVALSDDNFAFVGTANTFAGTQTIVISSSGGGNLSLRNDDGGTLGATMQFYHNSASPAVNDQILYVASLANNDAAGFATYASMSVVTESVTAGAESARWRFQARQAGTSTYRMEIGNGVIIGAPTGGFKGHGSLNAQEVYDDNSLLTCMALTREFRESGTVNIRFWDGKVPDIVIPERVERRPVMVEIEVKRKVRERLDDGTLVQRERIVTESVPAVDLEPVWDEDGRGIDAEETPVEEEVVIPARTVKRRHRTARLFKAMLDDGFDPRDPEQYFARMKADEALPGMPTKVEWEHNALSMGEQFSRKWLAVEMLAIVCNVMWVKLNEHDQRLKVLEAA